VVVGVPLDYLGSLWEEAEVALAREKLVPAVVFAEVVATGALGVTIGSLSLWKCSVCGVLFARRHLKLKCDHRD